MNDQEKLQEPASKKKLKTPLSWYNRQVRGSLLSPLLFVTFLVSFPLVFLYAKWGLDAGIATIIGVTLWTTFMVINVAVTLYRFDQYKKWMDSKYYKLTGWDEFFAKRSPEFWTRRNYAKMRISFNLAPDATDIHREAIDVFTKKVITRWKNRYQDRDMEWRSGAPKDLQTDGRSIHGDISQYELLIVVEMLVGKFIPVSKMLGPGLKDVVIHSDGKEIHYPVKSDKTDVYDRQSSWNTVNSFND